MIRPLSGELPVRTMLVAVLGATLWSPAAPATAAPADPAPASRV